MGVKFAKSRLARDLVILQGLPSEANLLTLYWTLQALKPTWPRQSAALSPVLFCLENLKAKDSQDTLSSLPFELHPKGLKDLDAVDETRHEIQPAPSRLVLGPVLG